jgi:lipid II:glycine glycyltransferase (peptidoglycan interpeptide bridge formation enzyme)
MISLWQSTDWEAFQKSLGHKTLRITVKEKKILGILNPLFLGYQYLYLPRIQSLSSEEWKILMHRLKILKKKEKLLFTRYDSSHQQASKLIKNFTSSHSPQPETTLILNINESDDKILAQMKRKGRYNINLAKKKGVHVTKATNEKDKTEFTRKFHSLLKETTKRDHFSAHSEDYYLKMLKHLKDSYILLSEKDNEILAGLIAVKSNDSLIYYYGASSNSQRELMAPYLLQWEAIKLAKKLGCKHYDFLGIAPEGAAGDHPWKGITSFKKKFGGETISYQKAKEVIHRPVLYRFFKIMKAIQKFIR